MNVETEFAALRAHIDTQAARIERLEHELGILQDKDEIQRLQYCYGFFMDNRMFQEMVDLFADQGAWMEIGGRGRWKIQGITVTMTYYASLQRERVSFPTAPPSTALPPDRPSQPVVEALGRQFNPWHFQHPIAGYPLPVPASSLNPHTGKEAP